MLHFSVEYMNQLGMKKYRIMEYSRILFILKVIEIHTRYWIYKLIGVSYGHSIFIFIVFRLDMKLNDNICIL